MKKTLIFLLMAAFVLLLPSCYATRTRIGTYQEDTRVDKVPTYKYAKAKQSYLLWGLIPVGRAQVATPPDGSCEVKTRHGIIDALITACTGGLFSMQTIKVTAPKKSAVTAAPVAPVSATIQVNQTNQMNMTNNSSSNSNAEQTNN